MADHIACMLSRVSQWWQVYFCSAPQTSRRWRRRLTPSPLARPQEGHEDAHPDRRRHCRAGDHHRRPDRRQEVGCEAQHGRPPRTDHHPAPVHLRRLSLRDRNCQVKPDLVMSLFASSIVCYEPFPPRLGLRTCAFTPLPFGSLFSATATPRPVLVHTQGRRRSFPCP